MTDTAIVDGAPSENRSERGAAKARIGRIGAWIVMVAVILVSVLPIYWALRTALSSNAALYAGNSSLLPADFTWDAFKRVFGLQTGQEAVDAGGSGQAIKFWQYLFNSVVVATLVTVGQVLFSAMAAYAFARLRWKYRNLVFSVFLAGLMVPSIFTYLPNFVLIKQLGLVDTLLGIALPNMLMTPFAVFFLRQFFLGISREIEEAATMDGASKVTIFRKLILPMSVAPISTLAILTYITTWNDYLWPLMVSYTDSSRVLTVALGVFKSQTPQSGPDWSGLMAATLVAALPMLILFAVFAKRIVNSIGFNGLK
ncbi:Binding-protein-dependent transport systems inner membrane component OS=Tsukamurella paurometabola(strain ATCC 8368 / DSM / CCUG 35730 / CIP 100753 / JCM 10117 / KCTC 9821 / NBRC 16120 / NCIMB 702349 / NCTC 13040)OX=521096 GN=Tpau_1638 PE=3 SV=1 [Tsukamurella paurometabola]|uniref:Binding-protein-dependent transport systems inner membrane component n=1 Tax=Tsukamurella paurometabola (strain ATCC 8368 / DSM 20162 / CCUG 35730 / CIP 100753 / JCM 10117 / KCTC 9821 / NBRC 16120 / NCIMB 702349 / NCTC 13040) TaxID=521096 RepID=D5UYF2_TSUPD|nr:carbohydrate ABC transporter permease [Tsukamurella paurometabola]ADG78259.1 binding-protein-dependent transport systems inner membrane component [Tsukamurella paurometabola DSM 20162]SUP30909.1 Inner membrane ABC transporter permease protein ycjP [Tsukamurella paurometabola]